MKKYKFRECNSNLLEKLFGLRRVFSSQELNRWLQTEATISEKEQIILENYQELLLLNSTLWNEQELAMHFIGPVMGLARFTEPYRFNFFSERTIGAVIQGNEEEVELSGEPDGILATGYHEPELPFFAFTEYKRQIDATGDPIGQTLAAMLVAQRLNPQTVPIYGCYVVGRDWSFMILQGKQYAISVGHNALQRDELDDILRVLKGLKQIVLGLTEEGSGF